MTESSNPGASGSPDADGRSPTAEDIASPAVRALAASTASIAPLFQELFQSNPVATILKSTRDGRIIAANGAFSTLVGLTSREIVNRHLEELPVSTIEPAPMAPAPRGPHVVWMNTEHALAGEPCVLGFVQDVTELKRSKSELAESFREISDLKQALDEHAIVAITTPQGAITYVNEKFCAISKYSRDELIGQDHRIINSGCHPKEFFRELWATIAHGKTWKGEIKNRAKDGSYYWVETTIVPFLNVEGKPYQYVAVRADITELKRAEERILELNATLEHRIEERTAELRALNKELEAFSYSVSHDLKAPLRAVDGFARMLAEEYGNKLDAEGRRLLGVVQQSAKEMGQLINDLLAFSRMSRAELTTKVIDMRKLVDHSWELLAPSRTGRMVQFEIATIPPALGDAPTVREVLLNLLGNALKFTQQRDHAIIQMSGAESDGYVRYEIRDNGVGFDMAYSGKLFGVFQRLHSREQFEGTGIGLALVQRIIQRHHGQVGAQGIPGQGASFWFTLPSMQTTQTAQESL
jgi:PAS domain S-box-containing protein